jgi:enamine deaminase RidA (YjgF/YER057c/UK114 family)
MVRIMTGSRVAHNASTVSSPPGFSHAVQAGGLLFVSGQVALDSDGNVVGAGDMAEQTRQVFRNLTAVLQAAGASLADVVKLTYFVCDLSAVPVIRAARNEFIDPVDPPASTLVGVTGLVHPDLLIEVEAVALAPSSVD